MTVYTKLSDDFDRHSGSLENYYQSDVLTLANAERHYNIREFINENPTVPWTMNDMKLWNAYHFTGLSMDTLGRRRSIAGRTFRQRIMDEFSVAVDGGGTDTTFMTMGQMNALVMDSVDHAIVASGNEEWPIDAAVTFGKNSLYRYANTISVTLTDGVSKTVSSYYNDDLITDFNDDTYFIELVLRNLPAQTAVARLDLEYSFIDFSSSLSFDPTQTDSVAFSESLNDLSAGGDTYFRVPRARLQTCNPADIKAIRFRLVATAAPTTEIIATADLTGGNLIGTYDYKVTYVIGGVETTVRDASNAIIAGIANPTAQPVGVATGVGQLSGAYEYGVTLYNSVGETQISPSSPAQVVATLSNINVANVPTSSAATLGRHVWRRPWTPDSGDGRFNDGSFGVWEDTTNLCPRSGTSAAFTTFQGGVLTNDATQVLFTPGDTVKLTTPGVTVASGGEGMSCATGSRSVASNGVTYTASLWIYSVAGGENVSFGVDQFDGAGTYLSSLPSVAYTLVPGWQRLVNTVTPNNVSTAKIGATLRTRLTPQAITVWIVGMQVENKPTATPLVRTTGSTAARGAAAIVTAPTSLVNATQVWFAVRLRMGFDAAAPPVTGSSLRIAALTDSSGGAVGGRLLLLYRPNAGNVFSMFNADSTGSADTATSPAQTFLKGDYITLVGCATATQIKLSLNGGAFVTVNRTRGIPTVNRFDIGNETSSPGPIDSDVLWFACGSNTLNDADAATLHSFGNSGASDISSLPGTPTMNWTAQTTTAQTNAGNITLTVSGNEITDATRMGIARSWGLIADVADNSTTTFTDTFVGPALTTGTVTASGNEITDATRAAAATLGTGSTGQLLDNTSVPQKVTNLNPNGGFETGTNQGAAWFDNATGTTVTRDTSQAYEGSASLSVSRAGGSATATTGVSITVAGGWPYTLSMRVKGTAGGVVQPFYVERTAADAFVANRFGAAVTLDGTWQLISVTTTPAAGNTRARLGISGSASTTAFNIDAVQLEIGSVVNNYVATDGAIVTSVTAAPPDSSFGIRRAATNLFTHGQCEATTGWGGSRGTETSSIDTTTPAPFSPNSIKVITPGGQDLEGIGAFTSSGLGIAAGTMLAGSIYFKGIAGQQYSIWVRWLHSDATIVDGATTNVIASGDWQLAAPAPVAVGVGKTGSQGVIMVRTTTQRAETFWAAHAMLEQGPSVVSPYVATSGGATATHAASRIQAPTSLLNAVQGWVAMRVRLGWGNNVTEPQNNAGFEFFFDWRAGGGAERITLFYRESANQFAFRRDSASGTGTAEVSLLSGTFTAGTIMTFVFAWDATTIYASRDGAVFQSVANARIPILSSAFDLGTTGGGQSIDSDMLWFACGQGTLTSADAAAINAFANNDPETWQLPGNPTMVWKANTTADQVATTTLTTPPVSNTAGTRINLSGIPIGPVGTTSRKIYRRKDGGAYGLLTTIANNTTTIFADNTAATTTAPPATSTLGNITFTAQAMRLVPASYSYPQIAANTKYNALRRSVPKIGTPEPGTVYGPIFFRNSKPENIILYARFNSGHNPVGNDNVLRLYTRYTDANNFVQTNLFARSTQSRIRIYENIAGVLTELFSTPINTNILTEEQDYWLIVTQDDATITASIYIADGVSQTTLVYTTGPQAVTVEERGYVGYSHEPYNYDFNLLSVAPQEVEYAHFESTPLTSVTPVVGATLFAYDSQPISYLDGITLDQSGDATATVSGEETTLVRGGTNWYGGIVSDTPVIVGDTDRAYVTGEIFPVNVVRGNYMLALVDGNMSVAWVQPILDLLPNQWNEFTLDIAGNLSPIPYYFYLHQSGFYADTYRLRNVKLASQSIAWEGSADSINWQPFYRALNDPYSGLKFTNRGNRAKIRATAMSDDAWLQGYELTPHYGYPGHKP